MTNPMIQPMKGDNSHCRGSSNTKHPARAEEVSYLGSRLEPTKTGRKCLESVVGWSNGSLLLIDSSTALDEWSASGHMGKHVVLLAGGHQVPT